MIARQEALELINSHVENKNIVKHMLALEAVMGALYDKIQKDGERDEWMMAGLLHDGDYSPNVSAEKQGVEITNWARGKGCEIPEIVAHAMAAHNWHNTHVEPVNQMDWAIFCADSLTGLIVACALVLPSKKLADVTVEMVLKKFKNPSFAAGTRRDEVALCQEKLGIPLEEFVEISLSAMQQVAAEIGL